MSNMILVSHFKSLVRFVVSSVGEVLGVVNIFDICKELLRREALESETAAEHKPEREGVGKRTS